MDDYCDFNSISKKVESNHSALELVDYVSHITLPPSYFGNIKDAVTTVLTNILLHYSQTLNGLPLAYNNKKVKLLSRVGKIISDQPYVHFDVETKLVIFKPEIGNVIKGKIHRLKHQGQLSCLIHDYVYAFVIYSKKRFTPQVGDTVLFKVTKLENDGFGLLSVIGELESIVESHFSTEELPTTETAAELDSGIDDDMISKSISTNERTPPSVLDEGENMSVLMQPGESIEDETKLNKKKKKKAKKEKKHKSKTKNAEFPATYLLQDDFELSKKKKKEKKKKEKKKKREKELAEDFVSAEIATTVQIDDNSNLAILRQDLVSLPKQKKSKKEKKREKELERNSPSIQPMATIDLEETRNEQTLLVSPNQSLIITDVRTLKGDQDETDLTGAENFANAVENNSVSTNSMKESCSGFIPIYPDQNASDPASLRSWLNSNAPSETTDQALNDLLTFTKKGTKRKRAESETEPLFSETSNSPEKLPGLDAAASTLPYGIVASNVDENQKSDLDSLAFKGKKVRKPKLKRVKLDKNIANVDSELKLDSSVNLQEDAPGSGFGSNALNVSEYDDIQISVLTQKDVKTGKTVKCTKQKVTSSLKASCLAVEDTLASPPKSAFSSPLVTHYIENSNFVTKNNDITNVNNTFQGDKTAVSNFHNLVDVAITSKQEKIQLKLAQKEKRKQKERKKLSAERRAAKAKKREQKQLRRLQREEKRKMREERRKEKEERRKLREEKRKAKEQKRLVKENKLLHKDQKEANE